MRVHVLGTGSADRWPNPWCRCPSCTWARGAGVLRDRTSVLVDDVLLVDPGPDAGGRGVDLAAVRTVLITHDHPDHLDPAFLLAWQWARAAQARAEHGTAPRPGRGAPDPGPAPALTVAGPPDAVERCRQWIAADAPVRLLPLGAGDVLDLDPHRVRALPAAHSTTGGHTYDGTALLYEITGGAARLLYATDTRALPHDDLAVEYDLVLLEQTFGDTVEHRTAHLDLPCFAQEVAALRDAGRLARGGRVVAVHLSHHNGPDLIERLAALGASTVDDGTLLRVGPGTAPMGTAGHLGARPESVRGSGARVGPTGAPMARSGDGGPGATLDDPVDAREEAPDGSHRPARPPRRLLVTGGARSGKSHHAEAAAAALSLPVTYVATAPRYPEDPDWSVRIAAHRDRRPASWRTVESTDVAGVLRRAADDECVLVDCLTLWLTALIDDVGWDDPDLAGAAARSAVTELVAALQGTAAHVVLVTNEVGAGVVPEHASGRLFRDLLGRTNVVVADACSEVALVTAGLPLMLKGASWTSST